MANDLVAGRIHGRPCMRVFKHDTRQRRGIGFARQLNLGSPGTLAHLVLCMSSAHRAGCSPRLGGPSQ